MCGIAGYLSAAPGGCAPEVLERMGNALAHRGPDDSGVWYDTKAGIGLSHRRLSIIDLSPAGHQPMVSPSGRYVIVFNGEIYNHSEIRKALEEKGHLPKWRSHSDTETLLTGFDVWGIETTLKKSIGMFAIALWDRQDNILTLCRDRLGEKPLYYGWQGSTFLFGSELKAFKEHPAFRADIDRSAIALMMRHQYIPAPYSIYRGIQKLLPGSLLTVSLKNKDALPRCYWDARQIVADGLAQPFTGSPQEAVDTLESLLKDAVAKQMIADVPWGAFLSGGIDSSTIVALMQTQSRHPVSTFTIGFHDDTYNEAEYAKAVARHLGTDHTELYISSQEAQDVIPRLPDIYCEPFSDSSQIPTFLISQMTRRHVTVSLSGDAGDELFGGYNRYASAQRLWNQCSSWPVGLKKGLGKVIGAISPQVWNRIFDLLRFSLPRSLAQANLGDKFSKRAEIMTACSSSELYRLLVSHWSRPSELVLGAAEPLTVWTDSKLQLKTDCFVHQMMAFDIISYLPDDILCKVDRAAMAVNLETRMPFLDHRVVALAWRFPLDYKVRGGVTKWPLRQILQKYIPEELTERPKKGFSVPVGKWLCGSLRDWAESLLDGSRLRQEGYFNPELVRKRWEEHLSGKRNWQASLWDVLMFQAWLASDKK